MIKFTLQSTNELNESEFPFIESLNEPHFFHDEVHVQTYWTDSDGLSNKTDIQFSVIFST